MSVLVMIRFRQDMNLKKCIQNKTNFYGEKFFYFHGNFVTSIKASFSKVTKTVIKSARYVMSCVGIELSCTFLNNCRQIGGRNFCQTPLQLATEFELTSTNFNWSE